MNEILGSYVEDLRESLLLFNEALMLLDQGNTDSETINRVFRVAHTIKGNSAAMEFFKVEKVMHTMEDILHEVREDKRELTDDITDVMYKCHDFLEDFLEILLRDENDSNVKSDDLYNRLVKIKNADQEEVQEESSKEETKESFIDEAFSMMDSEVLEVIEKNVSMGMFAYQMFIKFKPTAEMKSIRAFMLFQKIESASLIAYSQPGAPTEEEFRNGDFSFNDDMIKLMIISDNEAENLAEEVREDFSVENVNVSILTKKQIQDKIEEMNAAEKIIGMIDAIEVDVLDVEKSEINTKAVEDILDKLNSINNVSELMHNEIIGIVSSRLINVLEVATKENKSFPPEDAQLVALLLKDMSEIAKNPVITADMATIKHIEKNLRMLEEEILQKEARIGDILRAKGLLSDEDIEQIISKQNEGEKKLKFGQVAVKEKKVSAVEMTEVLKEQKRPAKESSGSSADASRQIRVSVNKVDNLIDMLGELIILNSQMEQQLSEHTDTLPEISNSISRTSKIVRTVQDLSMSLRLIQIKNTLFRLTRIIRDTAGELGKKVNISITGDEIEIDRSAAEKIFDPLMHLVRNSVSHGVETPEERVKAGKPPEGTVEINAYSKRGSVYVEVRDDGSGIDPEQVLAKAKQLGLAEENRQYSESEIVRFIMEPGFSTQTEVNNISGRGVGMNVVESEIAKIGGKVEIENHVGKGCAFILKIPMNLALINGTIVEISGDKYIIPTLFIKEFNVQEEDEWISMQGRKRAVRIREDIVPIASEETIFQTGKQTENKRNQIIVLEMEHNYLGLPVDNILGRQEVVSKPLNSELAKSGIFSGASILGDGNVSMILDVEAIYKLSGF